LNNAHWCWAIRHGLLPACKLEIKAFEPGQLICEIQALFSGSLDSKDIAVQQKWFGPPGQRYWSDAHRLRQMLSNLVGNALKFTAQGTIQIEGVEVERNGDFALLEFSVSDTGIGVPPEKLDLLFRPFEQADSSTTREFGGTGLGLSIVRNLALLMDGDAGAESQPGKGSRFWFRIRARIVPAGENSRQSERLDVPKVRASKLSGRVLVVEDNPINRKVIESLLKKLGLSFTVANDGQQAVNAITGGDVPDVVLMDVQMPVMDGFEATRRIRAWEIETGRTQVLPIVAMTANAFESDKMECMTAGMNEFLSKPFNFDDLSSLLNKYLPVVDNVEANPPEISV
ncbi:MAG: ATP-binding protein, partial [Betaproteobacteria bacterium]